MLLFVFEMRPNFNILNKEILWHLWIFLGVATLDSVV